MRCLYCGKQLALLRRLTGGGEFCSEAHKRNYHEEYNQLALSRLLQAQSKSDEIKPPSLLPANAVPARKGPLVSEPASGWTSDHSIEQKRLTSQAEVQMVAHRQAPFIIEKPSLRAPIDLELSPRSAVSDLQTAEVSRPLLVRREMLATPPMAELFKARIAPDQGIWAGSTTLALSSALSLPLAPPTFPSLETTCTAGFTDSDLAEMDARPIAPRQAQAAIEPPMTFESEPSRVNEAGGSFDPVQWHTLFSLKKMAATSPNESNLAAAIQHLSPDLAPVLPANIPRPARPHSSSQTGRTEAPIRKRPPAVKVKLATEPVTRLPELPATVPDVEQQDDSACSDDDVDLPAFLRTQDPEAREKTKRVWKYLKNLVGCFLIGGFIGASCWNFQAIPRGTQQTPCPVFANARS